MKNSLFILTAAALFSGCVAAADPSSTSFGKPARINFASMGGIRDWHADSDRSLYIMDRTGRWYYATLAGPCPSLRFESQIAFETGALGELDHWGVIRTRDLRCHIASLVTSPRPEAKGGPRVAR